MRIQPSRPIRAGAQSCSGFSGFLQDLGVVKRGEPARPPQNAPVGDHRVHVARLRERDERLVGVTHGGDVDIASAHQDNVGPFARRQRAGPAGDSKIDRAGGSYQCRRCASRCPA